MANIPISSFTAAANATGIGMSGFSLTGANAQSMLDLAGTWNTSGLPTGIKLNVTDTASNAASLLMDLQVGGVSRVRANKSGVAYVSAINGATGDFATVSIGTTNAGGGSTVQIAGGGGEGVTVRGTTGFFAFSSVDATHANRDLVLARDAANTLAQRNGVNAQAFRVYNTFTDASNYERLSVSYVSNIARIETAQAGTGTSRILLLRGDQLFLRTGASGNGIGWQIDAGGNFMAATDNTHDIGASGATRPRNLFLGAYQEMSEMTAPAAPAANNVRIYAEDNGAGKTRLMARFATGAAVQIAIEP